MEMVFMTDHLEWSATSVLELYRCRWDIEVFFKECVFRAESATKTGINRPPVPG
jgi:IS4 transposase